MQGENKTLQHNNHPNDTATTSKEQQQQQIVLASDHAVNDDGTLAFKDPCWIEKIALTNFKSYRGQHLVGPFSRFTSIIGPNGAGKSNILDAVSFVLGVQARHIRGVTLSDLIYRPAESPSLSQDEAPTYASVALVLRFRESGREVTFNRRVSQNGQSIFRIDGETVSADEYHERLAAINILTKVRNFLVFQGDVVDVATKSAADLGQLFEQVSRSASLAPEFDKLAQEAREASSQVSQLVLKRQRLETQAQDLQRQVTEVQHYRALEKQYAQARVTLTAYQLYVNEVKAGQLQNSLTESNQKLTALEEQSAALTNDLRQADTKATGARLERKRVEQAAQKLRTEAQEVETALAAAAERLAFEKRRRVDLQKTADELYLREKNLQSRMEEHEALLSEVDGRIAELQRSAKEASELSKLETTLLPTAALKKEYAQLKQVAAAEAAGAKALLATIESRRKATEARLEGICTEIEECERQLAATKEKQGENKHAEGSVAAEIEELNKDLNEAHSALQRLNEQIEMRNKRMEALQSERQQLEFQLASLQANQSEMERARRKNELISQLQAVFPRKVHGTMISLCRPASRRYAAAMTVALGKFADCVVVDSFDTAKRAVQHLKEHRSGVLEFAPLDTLKRSPVDSRLSKLKEFGCKAAIDCVQFDAQYEAAFLTALHDSVIVDSLEDANRLAYVECPRLGLRIKVVTIDGEKILKNGNITADFSSERGGGSWATQRFDAEAGARLSQQLVDLNRELEGLRYSASQGGERELASVQSRIRSLENALSTKKCRQEMHLQRRSLLDDMSKRVATSLLSLTKQKDEVTAELKQCDQSVEEAQKSLTMAEHKTFKPLTDKGIDIAALREAERKESTANAQRGTELARLNTRKRRIQDDLSRLGQQCADLGVKGARKDLEAAEKRVSLEERELKAAQRNRDKRSGAVAEAEEAVNKADAALRDAKEVASEFQQKLGRVHRVIAEMRGLVAQQSLQSENLFNEAKKLLRDAVLEGIQLPLLKGTWDAYKRLLGLQTLLALESQDITTTIPDPTPQQDQQGDVQMEGAGATAALPSSTTQTTSADNEEKPEIDYERVLSKELMDSCGSEESIRAALQKVEQQVGSAKAELNRGSPNLRSEERFAAVAAELRGLDEEVGSLTRQKERKQRRFNELRRRRNRRFLTCFKHVQKSINAIYGKLTSGGGGGGRELAVRLLMVMMTALWEGKLSSSWRTVQPAIRSPPEFFTT